jgi:divalent metal cation (Fe/Co/Zn/Cd) transporter
MTVTSLELSAATRLLLLRRGLRLEYATIAWNVVGSVLVLAAAATARSVALAGFGLDSLIEIVASAVVVWQLKGTDKARERKALRLIGYAFVLLALYVGAQSLYVLAAGFRAHHSLLGICWLALTALAMFALAYGKSSTGAALGNRALESEARVTIIDGLLAVAVLIGLALNAALGWWWADPLAALGIAAVALREGRQAWRGEACGCCA